jgi:hypothetical protein
LVLGDVQIFFQHVAGNRLGSSIPNTGHGSRNVMFVQTPMTQSRVCLP